MSRTFRILLIGSLLTTSAFATTYVRVEKDGTKTYSDRPLAGGQPVEIEPAQTYSAPPASTVSTGHSREAQELLDAANFRYAGCALSPRADETFTNPQEVAVSLALTPSLRAGDRVNISVDGAALLSDAETVTTRVVQPERGAHTINARVMDRGGKTVCDTSTTFHVQRASLNSPTRVPPRAPPPRPTPH